MSWLVKYQSGSWCIPQQLLVFLVQYSKCYSTNLEPIPTAINDTWGWVSLHLICSNSLLLHWPSVSGRYSVDIFALDVQKQGLLVRRYWVIRRVFSVHLGNIAFFLVASLCETCTWPRVQFSQTVMHIKWKSIFIKLILIVVLKLLLLKA